MNIERAKEIISILAEGIDPITGEVLPDECICNKPEVIRAFYCILNEKNIKSKALSPENAGKPWTEENDVELTSLYNSGMKKSELQKHFKRTSASIEARLLKLGLMIK